MGGGREQGTGLSLVNSKHERGNGPAEHNDPSPGLSFVNSKHEGED